MRSWLIFALAAWVSAAPGWDRFRGPNGTGVLDGQTLPDAVDRERNVAWKVDVPAGHSSPIIVNGRLFLTGHDATARLVLCYDALSGRELWRRSLEQIHSESPHPLNGPTSPTAASDGRSLFVFLPDVGLAAYSLEGELLWRQPLGPFGAIQGMAVSPVYADGHVLLLVDTPDQAYLAAFHAGTGEMVWKAARPIGFLGSYATPAIYYPPDGPAQVIAAGAVELTGYDVRTGARLWWAQGVTSAPAAPPLVAGNAVYSLEPSGEGAPPFSQMLKQFDKNGNGTLELSELQGEATNLRIMARLFGSLDKNAGNNDGRVTLEEYEKSFHPEQQSGGLVRFRLGGSGDVSSTHLEWRRTRGIPYVTGPLLYRDLLYIVRNGGILTVLEPRDGKVLREERLKDAIGDYYASPVAGDGKIYFVNQEGKVSVIQAGADWKVLATGDLDEQVIATPAISGNSLYIRTAGHLYCFRTPASQ